MVRLIRSASKLLHTVPLGFGRYIQAAPGLHISDYSDVICVMMDICGSTLHANAVKSREMAELMHKTYMVVNDVVLHKVFPYAYIHEIVGDSVLLMVNADFMVRVSRALLCESFIHPFLFQQRNRFIGGLTVWVEVAPVILSSFGFCNFLYIVYHLS